MKLERKMTLGRKKRSEKKERTGKMDRGGEARALSFLNLPPFDFFPPSCYLYFLSLSAGPQSSPPYSKQNFGLPKGEHHNDTTRKKGRRKERKGGKKDNQRDKLWLEVVHAVKRRRRLSHGDTQQMTKMQGTVA